MYKAFAIGEGAPTVSILDVILMARFICRINKEITRKRNSPPRGRCLVNNQTQEKMHKRELSEGPYGITYLIPRLS